MLHSKSQNNLFVKKLLIQYKELHMTNIKKIGIFQKQEASKLHKYLKEKSVIKSQIKHIFN